MRRLVIIAALVAAVAVPWSIHARHERQAANLAALVKDAGPFGAAIASNPDAQEIADLAAIGRNLKEGQ